jgi:hypothetical protein
MPQLLAGIHQTANLLHTLGVGPHDAVAVLLPGCLEYHLALWGGEAAGIVQPLNPLLTDEKLVALMTAARAKVLIAYGSDSESGMWSKAMRLRGQVPTLTTVLRVAPHDEAPGAAGALPEGVAAFDTLRAAQPSDRLVSGRDIAPTDIAAYFHTGGTTGAPKLARHSHGAQVFTAWASVQLAGMHEQGISINGYPLFHVAGVLPASLSALSAGVEVIIPTHLAAAQQGGAGQLLAAGREVPADLALGRAHGARGAGERAAGRRRHLLDHLLPHRRRRARARAGRALRAAVRPACAREPGHDGDGRHLDHHAAGRGRARGLRGLSPAVLADPHRRARRARQRERPRRGARRTGHGALQVAQRVLGFRRPGGQRQGLHRRRLARHRRPGLDGQRGAAQPHRPLEGPDHPQRPQHRSQDHRGRAGRAPGRAAVRGGRRARRLCGRAARDLRDAGARRLGHRRRAARLHRRARGRSARQAQVGVGDRRHADDQRRKDLQARAARDGRAASGDSRRSARVCAELGMRATRHGLR